MVSLRSLLLLALTAAALPAAELIRPKVIVLATFEVGADTGDKPGEFQYWVEREKLTGSITVPGLDHPVRFNDQGVYGVVSGTTVRSGLQIMALCLDPRFDINLEQAERSALIIDSKLLAIARSVLHPPKPSGVPR